MRVNVRVLERRPRQDRHVTRSLFHYIIPTLLRWAVTHPCGMGGFGGSWSTQQKRIPAGRSWCPRSSSSSLHKSLCAGGGGSSSGVSTLLCDEFMGLLDPVGTGPSIHVHILDTHSHSHTHVHTSAASHFTFPDKETVV